MNNLPPELAAQLRKAQRREKMAELMSAQSQQPLQGQMVSGHYVAPSPLQGIAQLGQAYIGARAGRKADEEVAGIGTQYDDMRKKAIEEYIKNRQGVDPGVNAPSMMQPKSKRDAVTEAMANPFTQDIAMYDLQRLDKEGDKEEERSWRSQESELAREQRMAELQTRIEDQRTSREEQANLRRELAELNNQSRADMSQQQRDFMAWQADENRKAAMERAMLGIRERQQAKLDEAKGKTDEAKVRVSVNLEALSDYYDELSRLGAAIDTEKSGMSNLSSRVRASGAGQLVGGAFGTEEQSVRNQINQMRPLLLQEIRQATAMGARGMDSNKELEFYLQAATSPERDIQSNKAAIQVLENAYGLSSAVKGVDQAAVDALRSEFGQADQEQGDQPAPSQGQILRFDAQGNLIQ